MDSVFCTIKIKYKLDSQLFILKSNACLVQLHPQAELPGEEIRFRTQVLHEMVLLKDLADSLETYRLYELINNFM